MPTTTTEDEQINRAHQDITYASAIPDRERLREVAQLAEARLEALLTGRGPAPAHVTAAKTAWRQVHYRALRAIANTYEDTP
ncbi:MAG: hypothetical protein ACRCSL_16650 [Microbacterium sp.]